jgi:hypothetical protein
MTLLVTIGIDPGQTGAIAVLADGEFDRFIDMPLKQRAGGGHHVDERALSASLRGLFGVHQGAYVYGVLEVVATRPGEGAVGAFRFGESYGVVRGVLGGVGIGFITVRPQVWKGYLGLNGREKDEARGEAMKRHPGSVPFLQRKKDCGRADALLIATWAEITEQVARAA